MHATPFLIVAAFEAVEKAVVARNKPRADAKTTLLSRFELLITFNSFDLTVPDLMGIRVNNSRIPVYCFLSIHTLRVLGKQ